MRVSEPFNQFVIFKFHHHQNGKEIDESSQDSHHVIPDQPKSDRNANYTSTQWMPNMSIELFIYQYSILRENEIDTKGMTD